MPDKTSYIEPTMKSLMQTLYDNQIGFAWFPETSEFILLYDGEGEYAEGNVQDGWDYMNTILEKRAQNG